MKPRWRAFSMPFDPSRRPGNEESNAAAIPAVTHWLGPVHVRRRIQVQIINEPTGRAMPDRTWERGLQQRVQAKEGVNSRPATGRWPGFLTWPLWHVPGGPGHVPPRQSTLKGYKGYVRRPRNAPRTPWDTPSSESLVEKSRLSRISYQRFFQRYPRISGVFGAIREAVGRFGRRKG